MKNCEYLGKSISSPLMLSERYIPRQWSCLFLFSRIIPIFFLFWVMIMYFNSLKFVDPMENDLFSHIMIKYKFYYNCESHKMSAAKIPNECLWHERWPVWGYVGIDSAQSS